ncbi:MAG: hypothetical protein U1E83_07580 [Methylotetracoccus sp.]
MTRPPKGALRPKTAVPFKEANLLDARLVSLADELAELLRFASDLDHDHPGRQLRQVVRYLTQAHAAVDAARPIARQLWNDAAAAEVSR